MKKKLTNKELLRNYWANLLELPQGLWSDGIELCESVIDEGSDFNEDLHGKAYLVLKSLVKYYKATVKWRTKAEGAEHKAQNYKELLDKTRKEPEEARQKLHNDTVRTNIEIATGYPIFVSSGKIRRGDMVYVDKS